ncbi:MAG: gas vesicle protein [Polyangiales bacterium]|jgi:gas vesicle protein
MSDSKSPKPPADLPPLSSEESLERRTGEDRRGDERRDVDEVKADADSDASPKEDMAAAFDSMKKAAGKLAGKADPALKGASDAMDRTFKGVSENVDAVIDKMDPAIESATKEAKRLAEKLSKSAEPVAKTVQEGIGRFADKLGKWARGDEAKSEEE